MSNITIPLKQTDRQSHVNSWRASGLTQAAYCRQHQLNATTFNGWVVLDRQASLVTLSKPLTVVPIRQQARPVATARLAATTTAANTAASAALSPSTQSSLILQHSTGWQLTLPIDVQVVWLAGLLKALA